ncbi:MarR family winged helix-turn-helix transcriptional regulator [Piscinibacter sp. HJYY11]|uniref:MarR family winged helix-turn-helix transcriptional regulator n=1 Tax=Piscinibacter sp. HJYY11 TaxID=2801333 RepID=UPI00191EF98D|nr:MarR family transcriptional regulator [Piscinibacter sp. HJYY11]MBL0726897.1 MarR family transcriptional regulator [Piscinibacter sp. HJYY11]
MNTAPRRHDAKADWLQLDQQLCFALYSTSLAMTKLYKPLLAPLGLTYPQYLAFLVLWERDGLTVGELGERLFLDSGTLTPLLKRMEASGWLTRKRAADDERRVVVHLTPEGRALRQKAKRVPVQLGQAMQCDVQEIEGLTQRLQQLRANLLDATAGDAAGAH